MAKITSFDQTNLKALREDINAALAKVCQKHGLNPAKLGNGSYSPDSFNAKILFTTKRKDFNVEVAKENPQTFIGRKFKMGQRTFTIERFDDVKGKLIGRTNRGKGYYLTPEQLITMQEVKY
jgi:hypothetical protein